MDWGSKRGCGTMFDSKPRFEEVCCKDEDWRRSMRTRQVLFGMTVILMVAITCPGALAQVGRGAIFGTVTDSQGAVIPNAVVTVTDVSTGTSVNARSDQVGNYIVTDLAAASYRLSCAVCRLRNYRAHGILLEVDQKARVDLRASGRKDAAGRDGAEQCHEYRHIYFHCKGRCGSGSHGRIAIEWPQRTHTSGASSGFRANGKRVRGQWYCSEYRISSSV